LEEAMMTKNERNTRMTKKMLPCLAVVVWMAVGGALGITPQALQAAEKAAQNPAASGNTEKQMTTQNKFFCNIKALTPEERAHHKQLTEKLMRMRKETVETATGYELQYSPGDVSLEELVDWVKAESKCCAFLDFHIDVEREGKLLRLRLTGEEGIKAFIRAEFQFGDSERMK